MRFRDRSNRSLTGVLLQRQWIQWTGLLLLSIAGLLTACDKVKVVAPAKSMPPSLAQELILYNWVDDMPQTVLDAFTKEYGVKVNYLTFESQEEALEQLRNGKIADVTVMENDFIPILVTESRLRPIDFRNVLNFKNISANFRDLAVDPGNRYTVPYYYGISGLIVRTDLVTKAVTRWADLWDPRYAGKIGVRAQPIELINIALVSLGYPLGSENPQYLEAALNRLLALKKQAVFVEVEARLAITRLIRGELMILYGWAGDYRLAHAANPAIAYVFPEEGNILWSENFVIPATSPNPYTAEVFINFLLRPEISAQLVNEKSYASANEAARPFVKPEILHNPVIFPAVEVLRRAQFYPPLSPAGRQRYDEIWKRFLAAGS